MHLCEWVHGCLFLPSRSLSLSLSHTKECVCVGRFASSRLPPPPPSVSVNNVYEMMEQPLAPSETLPPM